MVQYLMPCWYGIMLLLKTYDVSHTGMAPGLQVRGSHCTGMEVFMCEESGVHMSVNTEICSKVLTASVVATEFKQTGIWL